MKFDCYTHDILPRTCSCPYVKVSSLTVQFIIIFLTTSPASPFLDIPYPHIPVNPLRPLTSPSPDRSWLSWGEGSIWDPSIVGYREIAKQYPTEEELLANITVVDSAATKEDNNTESWWSRRGWYRSTDNSAAATPAEPSASTSIPLRSSPSDKIAPLPASYFDLRWGGLGFVIDFGFGRTEEGMQWEVEDAKRAVAVEEATGWNQLWVIPPKQEDYTKFPWDDIQAYFGRKEVQVAGEGTKAKDRERSMWDSFSFLGSW